MIPNITRGSSSSFAAALRYDLNVEKGNLLETNCASTDADGIAREMQIQAASSRFKNPMHHVSIRWENGEPVTEEQLLKTGKMYMQKMGYNSTHQYAIVRHTDIADSEHIHIVINRVDASGRALSDFQEKRRSQQACREIERELGFRQLENHKLEAAGKMNEIKAKLKDSIAEAKAVSGSIDDLKAALEKRGLELKIHQQSTGRIQGASISDIESGKTWKMSEVYGGKGGFKGVQNELSGRTEEAKQQKRVQHNRFDRAQSSAHGSRRANRTQLTSGTIDSGLIEGAATKEEVEYLIYLKNKQQSKSGGMQARIDRDR